jgi:hypothetical protein
MYQASFVLHLWEYGVSTSSAASGGAAGASYWAEPFIVWQASTNLTNEKTLEAALQDIDSYGDTFASDNAISIKPSGDTDDYLQFLTTSHVPAIKRIGGDTFYIKSDDAAEVKMELRSDDTPTGYLRLHTHDTYQALVSSGAIRLQPSGDTDDYLSFSTTGGIPYINIIGGNQLFFTTESTNPIEVDLYYSGSSYFQLYHHKASNYQRLFATGPLRIHANNDWDDYMYFTTAANIASLLPVEDKVHVLGGAALSFDHVYSDDFDNTSPYEKVDKPLDKLKAIKDKKDKDDKAVLDYASMPDFVRSHYRDTSKDKIEEYEDEHGNTQQRVTERAPKDQIADEGWSVNRMVLFLIQAVQELTAKVEALEAAEVPKA